MIAQRWQLLSRRIPLNSSHQLPLVSCSRVRKRRMVPPRAPDSTMSTLRDTTATAARLIGDTPLPLLLMPSHRPPALLPPRRRVRRNQPWVADQTTPDKPTPRWTRSHPTPTCVRRPSRPHARSTIPPFKARGRTRDRCRQYKPPHKQRLRLQTEKSPTDTSGSTEIHNMACLLVQLSPVVQGWLP